MAMKKTEKKTPAKNIKKHSAPQRTVSPRLLALVLVLVLLVVGITQFFSHDGPDYIRRLYYARIVRQAYHREFKNLTALKDLGLNEDKNIASTCNTQPVAIDDDAVSNVLSCELQSDAYVEVTASNKPAIVAAAKQLDDLIKTSGGTISTNAAPTFGQYFADITKGIDYYPDINATFVRDNYSCTISVNVAYSNPKPPAYSVRFGCSSPRVATY